MIKIWGGGQMFSLWCFGHLMVSIVSMGVKTSYFLAIVKTRYFLTNLFIQSCFFAMDLSCFPVLLFSFVFMFLQRYMTAAFKKFTENIFNYYTEGYEPINTKNNVICCVNFFSDLQFRSFIPSMVRTSQ